MTNTVTFTPFQTSASLVTAPTSATELHISISSIVCNFDFGVENLGSSFNVFDVSLLHAGTFKDATNLSVVISDRIQSSTFTASCTGYDGVTDYSGSSGAQWSESKTKLPSNWVTYIGIPNTLNLSRRRALTVDVTGGGIALSNTNSYLESTWVLEYYWA